MSRVLFFTAIDFGDNPEEIPYDNKTRLDIYDIPRHDPLLVQIVEELGEEANGPCARLEIEEIPGNLYRIESYDGQERIILPDLTEDWVVIK